MEGRKRMLAEYQVVRERLGNLMACLLYTSLLVALLAPVVPSFWTDVAAHFAIHEEGSCIRAVSYTHLLRLHSWQSFLFQTISVLVIFYVCLITKM